MLDGCIRAKITAFGAFQMYRSTFEEEWKWKRSEYVAWAVRFVSYVAQVSEKKILEKKNFLYLVLFIWSLKLKAFRTSW